MKPERFDPERFTPQHSLQSKIREVLSLLLTARQDQLCGYRDAWDLLDTYPRATFAVLDRAGHLVTIEQDELCHALMGEWLDRVEEGASR